MAIKRYYLTKDNTITNAFKADLLTRGTDANMGASDILEAFVIHGQTSASINAANAEQSRILVEVAVDEILQDIENEVIPSSSVSYVLKMYNAPHADSLPMDYSLDVAILTSSWAEGTGLDMENYSDRGASNWISGTVGTPWTANGSDYNRTTAYSSSFYFSGGVEDLELNIDFAMDKWRTGTTPNYGLVIKHPDNIIAGGLGSYFTKKFFSRTSDFNLFRPYVEARWDSRREDDRGKITKTSVLRSNADNMNTLFLYNTVDGNLKDIPNLEGPQQEIFVQFYSSSNSEPTGSPLNVKDTTGATVTTILGGLGVEKSSYLTGAYSCSFGFSEDNIDIVHDVWHSGSVQYYTGSFSVDSLEAKPLLYNEEYVNTIENLQNSYIKGQKPVLRMFSRLKDWSPNIYTVATQEIEPEIINSAYYRIRRTVDNFEVIPFGTGSTNHTLLSYDVSGNYFELDTSVLEKGYSYNIDFVFKKRGTFEQQPETFKFRIEEDDE